MTKVKSLIILFIAVAGAWLIYNHFDKKEEDVEVVNRFKQEYNLVDENNVYKYSTIDEVLDVLQNKTGFVFFCTPDSMWCNYYAKYLNEELINHNIDSVYYYNIKSDRALNTIKYQRILELLDPYTYKDDELNSKIYMPDLTVVKNGKVIAHNNDTSLTHSDIKCEDYWTQEKINEFKNTIRSYVDLMNAPEEDIIEPNENIEVKE